MTTIKERKMSKKLNGKAKAKARAKAFKAKQAQKKPNVTVNLVDDMQNTTVNMFELLTENKDKEVTELLTQVLVAQFRKDGFMNTVAEKGELSKQYHLPIDGEKSPYLSKIQPLGEDTNLKNVLFMEDWEAKKYWSHHVTVTIKDSKTSKENLDSFPEEVQRAFDTYPDMYTARILAHNGKSTAIVYSGFMGEAA